MYKLISKCNIKYIQIHFFFFSRFLFLSLSITSNIIGVCVQKIQNQKNKSYLIMKARDYYCMCVNTTVDIKNVIFLHKFKEMAFHKLIFLF